MKKWTYTSIKNKIMTVKHLGSKGVSAASAGWSGFHSVTIKRDGEDEWNLERKADEPYRCFTWYVNNDPVELSQKHHHMLDELIWRMHKWN